MSKEKWNRKYAEKELLWPESESLVLREETAELSPGRALDLAAGEGRNAIHLARNGWEVRAVDFSEVAVERGRQMAEREALPIEWLTADLNRYTPPAGEFDLVMIFYLHMPWSEMERVLRRAAEAVAPGGLFLLVGHDRQNLGRCAGGPQDPQVLYRAEDVAALLEGFSIEKAHAFERGIEHEGERLHGESASVTAIDCLVRARRESSGN
jgi:SAM-dependent methyltransferase